MNESTQVEGVLKRYSSILEVIRAKENARRKVADSNSENVLWLINVFSFRFKNHLLML